MSNWLDAIKWDEKGLIPAIAQDYKTNRVLMVAWLNRESLELTVQEQRAIYWSRSRQKLWRKGEESGHIQKLHEVQLDCDADVIILKSVISPAILAATAAFIAYSPMANGKQLSLY